MYFYFKYVSKAIVLMFLFSSAAFAITNIESERLSPIENGWSFDLSLAGSGASGNTDKADAELSVRSQFKRDALRWFNILSGAYGESEGVKNESSSFFHSRVVRDLDSEEQVPHWAYESFVQSQQDEFTRLNRRDLVGVGLRYSVWPTQAEKQWALGWSIMYETEELDLTQGETDQSGWRWSFYTSYQSQLSEQSKVKFSAYYQPLASESGDFRVLADLGVSVKVSKRTMLSVGYLFNKDSRPPEADIEENDRSYYTKVSLHF